MNSANSSDTGNSGERLQKVLARIGYGSRRVCEDIISADRATINGQVARLGARVDTDSDVVAVDGTLVSVIPDTVTYLLNKPAGVVTTASDTHGRATVTELVPSEPRIFPVGRLDMDTEGLLLLTNDGDLAHRLTHPSFGVEKEYLAELAIAPKRAAIRALRDGVELEDGPTAPAKVAHVGDRLIKMTIHEGRNRQVRRMCDHIGCPVKRLVRTRIGNLSDPKLSPGRWRKLEVGELLKLQQQIAT